jgi:hypothetical protein
MRQFNVAAAVLCACAGACADVFPTAPHAANNVIPFGSNQTCTMHQVLASTLFSTATGGLPARITSIAFAPASNGEYAAGVTIRLGYTTRTPGQQPPIGLDIPTIGSPGVPNAVGAMTIFYDNATFTQSIAGASTSNFQLSFTGTPFVYDPSQGNLLVEVVTSTGGTLDLGVSRCGANTEGSRSYAGNRFTGTAPGNALRMDFTFTAVGGGGGCYANCDDSTTAPVLNVADFTCFLQRFAAGESYANCDQSTTVPVLNVADFTCFLQSFASGCP